MPEPVPYDPSVLFPPPPEEDTIHIRADSAGTRTRGRLGAFLVASDTQDPATTLLEDIKRARMVYGRTEGSGK